MPLSTDASKFTDPDAFYAALIDAIDTLDDDRAREFLAALALILANEIADNDVLSRAIEAARSSVTPRS